MTEHELASLGELHSEVRWAIEAGDLAHARAICERILADLPDDLRTLLLRAEVDLEEHRFEAATAGFQRVLQGDPESYLAYAGLGIAADHLRTPKRAVSWYSRALDLDPANAEIRNERDRLFQVAYPGRILPSGLSRYALGRSLFQSGFREEGVARFQSALARHPDRVEIRLTLAEALWAMARSGAARELLQQLVATHPRVVKANALLGSIAAEGGDMVRGRQWLEDVHAQDPEGFIAGSILLQSPLAEYATIAVQLATTPEPRESARPRASTATHPPSAGWVRWMRDALWTALRLIKLEVDEVATSRAAWARVIPHAADGAPPAGVGSAQPQAEPGESSWSGEQPRQPPPRSAHDSDDDTEKIYPGSARRRHRPGEPR